MNQREKRIADKVAEDGYCATGLGRRDSTTGHRRLRLDTPDGTFYGHSHSNGSRGTCMWLWWAEVRVGEGAVIGTGDTREEAVCELSWKVFRAAKKGTPPASTQGVWAKDSYDPDKDEELPYCDQCQLVGSNGREIDGYKVTRVGGRFLCDPCKLAPESR